MTYKERIEAAIKECDVEGEFSVDCHLYRHFVRALQDVKTPEDAQEFVAEYAKYLIEKLPEGAVETLEDVTNEVKIEIICVGMLGLLDPMVWDLALDPTGNQAPAPIVVH